MKQTLSVIAILILLSFVQKANTGLRITILNRLGNPVDSVEVNIYKTPKDYRAEQNQLRDPRFTDENGKVTYKKLESGVYFVHAIKGALNNDGLGVQTDTLIAGKLNKINIIVE